MTLFLFQRRLELLVHDEIMEPHPPPWVYVAGLLLMAVHRPVQWVALRWMEMRFYLRTGRRCKMRITAADDDTWETT